MTGWLVSAALAGVAYWLSRRLGAATADLSAARRQLAQAQERFERAADVATMDDDSVRATLADRVRAADGDVPPAIARDDSNRT